jgi:hypothetical protein
VDVDEIMCSYDFAWHPDVKDGKIHNLCCVLNDVVCECVCVCVCVREFVFVKCVMKTHFCTVLS